MEEASVDGMESHGCERRAHSGSDRQRLDRPERASESARGAHERGGGTEGGHEEKLGNGRGWMEEKVCCVDCLVDGRWLFDARKT